jgi:competence ComEA-like helix-hairpin-helix protein
MTDLVSGNTGLLVLACLLILLSFTTPAGRPEPVAAEISANLVWHYPSLHLVEDRSVSRRPAVPAHLAPFFFIKIPINRADSSVLEIVPGIGPQIAARIVEERRSRGRFSSIDDLTRVPGIGKKRKRQLERFLSFD